MCTCILLRIGHFSSGFVHIKKKKSWLKFILVIFFFNGNILRFLVMLFSYFNLMCNMNLLSELDLDF